MGNQPVAFIYHPRKGCFLHSYRNCPLESSEIHEQDEFESNSLMYQFWHEMHQFWCTDLATPTPPPLLPSLPLPGAFTVPSWVSPLVPGHGFGRTSCHGHPHRLPWQGSAPRGCTNTSGLTFSELSPSMWIITHPRA